MKKLQSLLIYLRFLNSGNFCDSRNFGKREWLKLCTYREVGVFEACAFQV